MRAFTTTKKGTLPLDQRSSAVRDSGSSLRRIGRRPEAAVAIRAGECEEGRREGGSFGDDVGRESGLSIYCVLSFLFLLPLLLMRSGVHWAGTCCHDQSRRTSVHNFDLFG
ncbi:unnamed protein product [Musa acuminata subsp. burmannicoides]